jgi:hypothetical protein
MDAKTDQCDLAIKKIKWKKNKKQKYMVIRDLI